jgi:hypothetical protein
MSKDTKLIRGQVRQIVKELFPEIFTKEVQDSMLKQLSALTEQGLASIKEMVSANLKKISENTEASENKILNEAGSQLEDMRVSLAAWQSLMTEKLDQACIVSGSQFNMELEAKIKAIKDNLKQA